MIKNLMIALLGGGLLLSPSFSQTPDDISMSEFRQALTDYLRITNTPAGLEAANQIATTVSDATLSRWYQGVPNGRRFANAVAFLKRTHGKPRPTPVSGGIAASVSPLRRTPASRPGFSLQFTPAAGIASTPVPDFSFPDPVYPSGTGWLALVNPLQGVGAMNGGDPSTQRCKADSVVALSVTVSTFHGIKDVAEAICNVVPDITVVILGEGATVPAHEICMAVNLIFTAFTAASEGFSDGCEAAGGFYDDAITEANRVNSIALYNLEYRLMVEENLLNVSPALPLGLFEVPAAQGGYLENARAIVADTITQMISAGQAVSSANAQLLAGDTYYNRGQFKLAYRSYQAAYGLAVQ